MKIETILRMDADVEEAYYKGVEAGLEVGDKTHKELIAQLAEKDAMIVELLQLQTKEALIRERENGTQWWQRKQAKRELHGGRK